MDLRTRALAALITPDPADKVAQVLTLQASASQLGLDCESTLVPAASLPGRPAKPELIAATDVPHRSPFTPLGLAALLHAICHIEFNAINLALDAVWRFPVMPEAYYRDWLRVAAEEAYHFSLLRDHLAELGFAYGDFAAHDGLWEMCEKTQGDITARMALVPRTLEARGLDATPQIQAKLRKVGTPHALQTVAELDIILRDEVGHVAVGNHWYRWLCERDGLDPVAHYATLLTQHSAPRLKAPINVAARRAAGFTEIELGLLGQS